MPQVGSLNSTTNTFFSKKNLATNKYGFCMADSHCVVMVDVKLGGGFLKMELLYKSTF